MNYSTGGGGILELLAGLGIISIILAVIFLLIHLVFVIYVVRMANEKGRSGLFYGIFALLLPELAFILLYNKNTNYGGNDYYGGY